MTLHEVCRVIETKKLKPSEPPFERYPAEVWRNIQDRLPSYLPDWYRCLTMEYRVGGFFFRRAICDREYIGGFLLPRPSVALCRAYDPFGLPQLLKYGFCAFAEDGDRNAWLMRPDSEPSDPVYFLESTAWNGDLPTQENGMIDPRCSFLTLLSDGILWKEEED